MRTSFSLIRHRKGAALAEYLPLMALISAAVIFTIVQFSSSLETVFDEATASIEVVGDPSGPTDPGGPGGPDGDPDLPVIPTFPPPPVPDTGVEYMFIYDLYLSYDAQTTGSYDVMAMLSDAGGQYHPDPGNPGPNAPADWFNNVTWTGVERQPYGTFGFNELEFTTTEIVHNIGPLPGWGPNPTSIPNCYAHFPEDQQYYILGQLPNGDGVTLIVNLTKNECVPAYFASRSVDITHSSGGYGYYGDIANAELAAMGEPNPFDWNDATWVIDYWDGNPDNGLTYSGLALTSTRYQYNLLAGPAWYYSSDPSGESTTCYETPFSTYGTVIGTHPSGATMTLGLSFNPVVGINCFVPFGG